MKSPNPNIKFAPFKEYFEAERERLVSRALIDDAVQVLPDDLSDEADLTSAELAASIQIRMRNRESLYLKKVEESLRRLSAGTFGLCDTCEEAIEPQRLSARPTATLCLTCKEGQEKDESLHLDGLRHKSVGKRLRFA